MNYAFAHCARQLLSVIRYADFKTSLSALFALHRFLLMLRVYGAINSDQYARLLALAANACRYCVQSNTERTIQAKTDSGGCISFLQEQERKA